MPVGSGILDVAVLHVGSQHLPRLHHPKQRGSVQQYLWMMDAILAWKEERYEDFLLLQKQVAERAVTPLQKVTANYYLAQGELVQSEDAAAREHLQQVLEEGCTTFMAAEAANILEEFALPEV